MNEAAFSEQVAVVGKYLHTQYATNSSFRVYIAGNGGSASDAQHFAAELVGRYKANRRALPCQALNTDTSTITAIANDFGYEHVFSRQLEAFGKPGDAFIAISTSGKSGNILKAISTAEKLGMDVILLSGRNCPETSLKGISYFLESPSETTAEIQEWHIWALHQIAASLETLL